MTSPGLTAKGHHLNLEEGCCCDILHHQHRRPVACVKHHLKCLAAQLSHMMGVIFPKFKPFRVCCENTPGIQSANCILSHYFNNKHLQKFVTPSVCVCVSLQTKRPDKHDDDCPQQNLAVRHIEITRGYIFTYVCPDIYFCLFYRMRFSKLSLRTFNTLNTR